jgi:acyl-CoA synthetase (AMP-forming)/AMP-acid ligase II
VPPVILGLAKHPDVECHDLSALRVITSGAAPLGREVAESCRRRLGCGFKQGYGLTETSPVTHMTPPGVFDEAPGTIGPCVPNTEIKVIDPEGRLLPPGEQGEICVRGPQVMLGYLNRPEATAAMIDSEGWLHTGDLGFGDERGRFFIVDRLKELIKYKGCQVAPAELEALLLTHPAVADAAVIGLPDPEAGEVPKAFVVLRQAARPAAIQDWVAERVAPFKRLRHLEVVDAIPKSASGKILRRLLVERERERGGA